MIPAPVRFQRPASITEAVTALANGGDEARPLAGGQSLIPMLRLRLLTPELLVDLTGIPGLRGLRAGPDGVTIGALATHHQVMTSSHLASLTLFADAGRHLGDLQVRNRGTFAGNLAHADPAGDWPAVALAAGLTLGIAGPQGERSASADGFFTYAFTPDLQPGEILTGVTVPAFPAGRTVSAYVKLANGASGYALAGVAVVAVVDDGIVTSAKAAATGVATAPLLLPRVAEVLTGKPLDSGSAVAAAAEAPEGVHAMSDRAASADYRLHLLSVACRRALLSAAARLPSGEKVQ